MFHLRATIIEDASKTDFLLKKSYSRLLEGFYKPELLHEVLPLIAVSNLALLNSGTFFIFETTDGQVIACGGYTKARPGQGVVEDGLGHVRHFATDPDFINQNLGRRLYQKCEENALKDGIRHFECYSSLNARGFYEAMGFSVIKPLDIPLRPDLLLPVLLMEKTISV